MLTYTTKQNQTLLDIAVQLYGGVEHVVKLVLDNELDINEDLVGGTQLLYDEDLFNLSDVSDQFQLNQVFIATSGLYADSTQLEPNLLEYSEEEHTEEEHN